MNLIRAIGAVGSALERHSRGHKFEPCIAHHKKSRAVRALFFMRYNRRELVNQVRKQVSRVRSLLIKFFLVSEVTFNANAATCLVSPTIRIKSCEGSFFMRYNRRELVFFRSVAKCKRSLKSLKLSCCAI